MTKNILILHGWALILNKGWSPFLKELKARGFKIYFPKIPGLLGKKLNRVWDLDDYTQWLQSYVKTRDINSFVLLGHSFGGSLAINYALSSPRGLKGLILISSSGVRKKTLKKRLIQTMARIFKIVLIIYPICLLRDFLRKAFYRLIGSTDYLKTDSYLTGTFQNILAKDLSPYFKKVKVRTLLLWGADDNDTPPNEGRLMHRNILHSKLVIFKDASHGLLFQKQKKVIKKIVEFINSLG